MPARKHQPCFGETLGEQIQAWATRVLIDAERLDDQIKAGHYTDAHHHVTAMRQSLDAFEKLAQRCAAEKGGAA